MRVMTNTNCRHLFMAEILCILFFCCINLSAEETGKTSWRKRMIEQKLPFVAQYSWIGGLNDELKKELFREYRKMGFTGLQRTDYDNGGRLFIENGLHGFMWQTYLRHPDFVLKEDGKPAQTNSFSQLYYGCYSSERNIQTGAKELLEYIKKNRDGLYVVDGKYLFSSWDETGMQDRHQCRCPHCETLFQEYLAKEIYKDKTPDTDTNNDGNTLDKQAGTLYKNWSEIKLPKYPDRFKYPVMWKHYMDFMSWKKARYFTRIEEEVCKAGEPMAFGTFYHSRMYWPGGGGFVGITPYYQAKNSPVIINEQCIADWPIAAMTSWWNDRLSRDYGKGVFDFSWFWSGFQGGEGIHVHLDDEYDRALARKMGHTLHGLLFWHYTLPVYNHLPEKFKQVAYWHNFLVKHWEFLKNAETVKPEIAVLFPGYASYFYKQWRYNKVDFGWGPLAFIEGQYPFTILQDEEIEQGLLKDYKVLYVFGAEKTSKKVLNEIEEFLNKGGYVFTDADSLLLDMKGGKSDLLKKYFGVEPKKKYKTPFWPSILSVEEESGDTWLSKDETSAAYKVPETSISGLKQETLNPDKEYLMQVSQKIVPSGAVRTFHDIVTGKALKGKVIGTFNNETAGVETEKTIWFGNRPGFDLYATYDYESLKAWGEPAYKKGLKSGWYQITNPSQRQDYCRMINCLAEKAGVKRPVVVLYKGKIAPYVEVVVKIDPKTEGRMIFLINHDKVGGIHTVKVNDVPENFEVLDVSNNKSIEKKTDGEFTIDLIPLRSRVLFVGPVDQVKQISLNQKKLLEMDLTPGKFTVGPKTLKEPSLPVIPPIPEPKVQVLPGKEAAVLTVLVENKDKKFPRNAEPIVFPVQEFMSRLNGLTIKNVSLKSGIPVQWDDLDENGVLSNADEIVWQSDFKPGETRNFKLVFSAGKEKTESDKNFLLKVNPKKATVILNRKNLFTVNNDNSWTFPVNPKQRIKTHPGAKFFLKTEVKDSDIKILGDGNVRKYIKVSHNYKPFDNWNKNRIEPDVKTTVKYAVYRKQVKNEDRIYADITHRINKKHIMNFRGTFDHFYGYNLAAFNLRGLDKKKRWYKDTLGRIGPLSGEKMERNCGGWIAGMVGSDEILAILLRRTEGVVKQRSVMDETDGVQVYNGALTRSFMDWNNDNIHEFIDKEILAGNEYHFDCMLVLKKGNKWQEIDALRQEFANPPVITISEFLVAGGVNDDE